MIKLYWCPRTRATRALWLLEELGEPFEVVTVDIRSANRDQDFLDCSPMGKVPAIRDGETKLADSAAIALYLADRYPKSRLAPALDHPDRANYLYWMIFTPGVMEPAMAEKFGGWEAKKATHAWGDYPSMIQTLEQGLSRGDWLLGDRFTAADVLVGSTCYFMRLFGAMPENKTLHDYTDRCLERRAFQRALAREGG